MLLGVNIECGYIPVIRTYAKHQLKLLNNVKKLDYKDSRAIYKSLPSTKHQTDDSTAAFFTARYGLEVDAAEKALRDVLTGNLTDCVDYSLLDVFTERDL